MGTLLADYLARKRPDLTIELLAIAGPNVGNKVGRCRSASSCCVILWCRRTYSQ